MANSEDVLGDRLRQAEAELTAARHETVEARMEAQREIEQLRANAEADNSHAMSTAADNERLSARIAELERIVVWLAEQVDCVTLPSTGGRKTVRFEGFSLGVKVISIDGTPAGLIAAVKEEMGDVD